MASIYQSRNGRWTAQINVGGTRTSKTFDNKTDATRWARHTEVAADNGKAPTGRAVKLGDVIAAYLEHIADLSPSRSKLAMLGTINESMGRIPLRDLIRAKPYLDFVKERSADGAGPSTIGQDLSYLRAALAAAHTLMDIDTSAHIAALGSARTLLNAAGAVSRSNERNRRPTEDELVRLKAHFIPVRKTAHNMWDIVTFGIATAMRLAEICRITWADLDEKNRTVIIRDRKHPKTKKGNDQEVPLLRGHVTIGGEAIDPMAIILRQPRGDGAIFGHKPESVSTRFTRATAALKIDDLHFHDMRHDGVSRMFAAGYTIEQVALVSGHKDWNMLRRYTQLRAADLHRADD
jgi:integrase